MSTNTLAADGLFVGEVVEDVADRDDRVRSRERVVREHDLVDVLRLGNVLACEIEHRRGGAGGDDAMSGVEQVASEQPAPAAELDHEAPQLEDGLEQGEDAGSTPISVEPEAEVVHEGETGAIVGRGRPVHVGMLPLPGLPVQTLGRARRRER